MRSSIVPREYEIMVALPRKQSESGKHPVLYVLDANGAFPIAVEMIIGSGRRCQAKRITTIPFYRALPKPATPSQSNPIHAGHEIYH